MDCRPGWILEEHDHPSEVFSFCIRGSGLLEIEHRSTSYLAGQLAAIPAGTRHSFKTGGEGALLIIFVFEPLIA
jgi:quercetin dioxygenase-like cupin family protein